MDPDAYSMSACNCQCLALDLSDTFTPEYDTSKPGYDFSMNITADMANYLGNIDYESKFLALSCLSDDSSCLLGICPNPDIAGALLRIARKLSLSFL